MRPSTKILIGAAVVAAVGYLVVKVLPTELIKREKFDPIPPGEVNIIGVDTSQGYYIVVANQMAQLVLGSGGGAFESPDKNVAPQEGTRKRLPLRDMMHALQGDPKALGKFVMILNNLSDSSLPAYPIVWKAEDLAKALEGDSSLRAKLVSDLGIHLDGTPAESVRFGAIQEGIVIDSPVQVQVGHGATARKLTGRIQEEFRPRFMADLDKTLAEKGNLTKDLIRAYYIEAARAVLDDPKQREDVALALRSRISPERLQSLAGLPEKLLNSITVIVTERQIVDGSYGRSTPSEGKSTYNMTLNLNEEGRKRLWHYSATHRGEQLLVVWDGIAIAAPWIQEAIPFAEVQIRQISDEGLIEDTLDAIRRLNKEKNPSS